MSCYAIRFSKLVAINIFLKNIIHPLLMLGLVIIFGVSGIFAKEAILLCAMPTATMTAMFALKYDTLTEESTTSAILGTIISLVTLTIFMVALGI
jgi:predicted permease